MIAGLPISHINNNFLFIYYHFRHADRDIVLEHVKTHYREDGTPQDRGISTQQQQAQQAQQVQASNAVELAPPPPLPIQMPFQIMSNLLNGHTSGTSNVHNRNLITLGGGGNSNQTQNPSNTHQTLNFNSQNTLLTPASSNNDVNRNNNGMPETNSTNSNNNSLKGSFRCGHCGQISNWKHVIQVYTNKQKIVKIDSLSYSFVYYYCYYFNNSLFVHRQFICDDENFDFH